MNIEQPTHIYEYIIRILREKPLTTLVLVEMIMKQHPHHPTKQGVYKALREMKEKKIIVITKGITSFHHHWLEYMANFITVAKVNSQQVGFEKNFLRLEEGERIIYSFNSAEEADIFWDHIFSLLIETAPLGSTIYTYTPHDWTVLTHHFDIEVQLAQRMLKKNMQYLATVGYNFPFDRLTKKRFRILPHIQYNTHGVPPFEKINYYFSIFGDTVIEVFPDVQTSQKIHNFFKSGTSWSHEKEKELENIVSHRGKVRMVISCNKVRAEKLKKKLDKDFYINPMKTVS